MFLLLFYFGIFGSFVNAAQMNLMNKAEYMNGFMFPKMVTVGLGETVFLKLHAIPEQDKCLYRSPGGNDTNVHEIFEGKVKRMRRQIDVDDCGIKIDEIHWDDAGFWRLTSVKGKEMIRGVTMLTVVSIPEDVESITNSLNDLTPEGTNYCYVIRSDNDQSQVLPQYENCSLPLSDLDPKGEGEWNIIAGVHGQTKELNFHVNVENKEEFVESSVHKAEHGYILSCNLVNSKREIKFCRFLRLEDSFGLHLNEGIGSGRYNYFGNGFKHGECGLEILDPDSVDKTIWKCYIGYMEDEDKKMMTSGAVLDASSDTSSRPRLEIIEENLNVPVFNGSSLQIKCNSKSAIDYCWFRSPTGKMYSVADKAIIKRAEMDYWYYGSGFSVGECGLFIKTVTEAATGVWTCHVGRTKVSSLEAASSINVKVTFTAVTSMRSSITVAFGNTQIIECLSVPAGTSLEYCRFVAPNGIAFSLNKNVTSNNAILGKYFANPNHNLFKGFCSLVVKAVDKSDKGSWICAGKLPGIHNEFYDLIDVNVTGSSMSSASIAGMSIGIIVVLVGLVGYGYYRKRIRTRTPSQSTINVENASAPTERAADSVSRISVRSLIQRLTPVATPALHRMSTNSNGSDDSNSDNHL